MSRIPYASTIGSIMYVVICKYRDVSYALSATSIYQSDLGNDRWTLVKNILSYLIRIKEVFLLYGGERGLVLKGYNDLSNKAEYIAASEASNEGVCIRIGYRFCKPLTLPNMASMQVHTSIRCLARHR